jgi:integrase
MSAHARANGEGSIYPYRDGYAAHVWVTTPSGIRRRKYAYAKTRQEIHKKWLALHQEARKGPVETRVPKVAEYLAYWLHEVVRPGLKPKSAETYAMHVRLYIDPYIGQKRLDKLTVRDVRSLFTTLANTCQCCSQGKDVARDPDDRRCCAVGDCCGQRLSRRSIHDVRTVLRSALSNAVVEELVAKNVASLVKVPTVRRRRVKPWTVEEARQFLVSAKTAGDPFYPAYVLMLVLGLRRGELLGLTWPEVDLETAELVPSHGLQRIDRRLVLGETKTEASEELLPLPDICVTALRIRQTEQQAHRRALGDSWPDSDDLVFTTRAGSPIEPRNFNRSFEHRCAKSGVRRIRVHDTRHTCGSLLAAMDVHPRVAMQILRHNKIDTTMEIYTHVPSTTTRRALKQLGASLEDPEP